MTANTHPIEQAATKPTTPKLAKASILGYGLGDLGSGIVWGLTTTFLLFFYTDIFGLTAAAVGTLFVVARVFDAVNDPIMGMITERFHTRWGKFRHYLLFGAPILGILLVFTFSTPELSTTAKLVYAYITYISMGAIYTAVNLPYGALATTMTQDAGERNILSGSRSFLGIIGNGLIVGVMTPILVQALGGGDAAKGWQLTAIIFAIIGVTCLWFTFFTSKEKYVSKEDNKISFVDLFKMVGRNKPFILIAVTILLLASGMFIRTSAAAYYVTYNLGQEGLLPAFLGISVLTLMVGLIAGMVIAAKIGKKATMMIGLAGSIVGTLIFHIIPYQNTTALLAVNALISFALALGFGLVWSMISDTVEYSEWQTGVRSEGGIYSIASFVMKLASAIAGGVPALILAVTLYEPNVEQTQLALNGIRSMMTIVPIIFSSLALVALYFYNLDEKTFAQILADLAARKEQS